mmetsp:Transcript_14574/g.36913  ORF Transcript_14574/g.36913 Transcript_14574/m.36913 type:complete len:248 (-) Transcript_14574:823-1566(-)
MVLHLRPSHSLNSILNQLSPPTQQLLQTSREEAAISARRRMPTMRKAKFGTFMPRRAKHPMRPTSGWMGCGSARGAMPPQWRRHGRGQTRRPTSERGWQLSYPSGEPKSRQGKPRKTRRKQKPRCAVLPVALDRVCRRRLHPPWSSILWHSSMRLWSPPTSMLLQPLSHIRLGNPWPSRLGKGLSTRHWTLPLRCLIAGTATTGKSCRTIGRLRLQPPVRLCPSICSALPVQGQQAATSPGHLWQQR